MSDVIFNGPNKTIEIVSGVVTLDSQQLYSDWKRWALENDNTKYLNAFSTIGGEPLGVGLRAGAFYFLQNNWKIKPWEGASYELAIAGNLFTTDNSDTVIPQSGNSKVTVRLLTSSLTQSLDIQTQVAALTETQDRMISELYRIMGLQTGSPLIVSDTSRSVSGISQSISESNNMVTITRT